MSLDATYSPEILTILAGMRFYGCAYGFVGQWLLKWLNDLRPIFPAQFIQVILIHIPGGQRGADHIFLFSGRGFARFAGPWPRQEIQVNAVCFGKKIDHGRVTNAV